MPRCLPHFEVLFSCSLSFYQKHANPRGYDLQLEINVRSYKRSLKSVISALMLVYSVIEDE